MTRRDTESHKEHEEIEPPTKNNGPLKGRSNEQLGQNPLMLLSLEGILCSDVQCE
jgi:hypothetical protein